MASIVARALLALHPPSFRKDLGASMLADVERRAGEIARTRSWPRALVWQLRIAASLAAGLVAAWAGEIRPRRRRRIRFSWLDVKLAIRMLAKYPGLTLTAGLGIAVAIAIGVGFFALTYARFFPSIPLADGDRLVGIEYRDVRTTAAVRPSAGDFRQWRDEIRSVEDISAFRTVTRNAIAADGSVEVVRAAEITPSGFRLARVPPWLGRGLVEGDAAPHAPPVIVIGFDVWRSRFASAPDVIGRELRLGRTIHTIVGVMPDGFAFPVNHRFWIPLAADGTAAAAPSTLFVAGRLANGVTFDDANREILAIGGRDATLTPETHRYLRPEVLPYTYPFMGAARSASNDFWIMAMLASLLLVVVSVNVAILIYARTATRLGEIAVRSALGASRGRVVLQLFVESLVLSGAAASAGLGAVSLALRWARVNTASLGESTFWTAYGLTGEAFAYFVALTLLAAVVTGVVPAWRATSRSVQHDLRQFTSAAGLRLGRTWSALIVVQVAVASAAMPIAIALGWFQIRDVFNLPRFPVDRVVFARLGLDGERVAGLPQLQQELARRLAGAPGVTGVSFTGDLPGNGRYDRVATEDVAAAAPAKATRDVLRATIDAQFLTTFGVDLLSGRGLDAGDQADAAPDVILVSRAFVRRVLGGADALGQRVGFVGDTTITSDGREATRTYEIVGVVEDIDVNPFDQDRVDPRVYHPLKGADAPMAGVAIRMTGAVPASFVHELPSIAAAIDPSLQLNVLPLAEGYRLRRAALNGAAIGIGVALGSVLLLCAAGIYALMSFTVAQRRREIAIRTALGAQSCRLFAGIFGRALRQIAAGVIAGVALALWLDLREGGEALQGSRSWLLTGTVLVMTVVGLAAAFGPARRGLRIQPAEVLKSE